LAGFFPEDFGRVDPETTAGMHGSKNEPAEAPATFIGGID
jgi:hypothetical protein